MNKKIDNCRICGSPNLIFIGDFGNQYLVNFPDKINKELPRELLNLVLCRKCGLLQLEHTTDLDSLYNQYWYVSGTNQTMKDALKDVVEKAEKLVGLKTGDGVIDIGSNDGTLLRHYKNPNILRIGFEPAKNLISLAGNGGKNAPYTGFINDFFNYESYKNSFYDENHIIKAKVITAIAMFYDLDEPNVFVDDMKKCLHDDGIIVIQLNYLPLMLEANAFDNVSHEHLEYYSLFVLKHLFERHDLDIFDLDFNDVNGGSLRIYICKKGERKISPRIEQTIEKERLLGLDTEEPYREFVKNSQLIIKQAQNFIKEEVTRGKKIYIYGASTRGTAFLQASNLDSSLIKAAADRNPMKWGRLMVGSWIPIISEEQARKEKPDYFLVLPWQFLPEMVKREKEYLESGGKFIVIFPKFEIYGR